MLFEASDTQGNRFSTLYTIKPECKSFIDNLHKNREHFENGCRKILEFTKRSVSQRPPSNFPDPNSSYKVNLRQDLHDFVRDFAKPPTGEDNFSNAIWTIEPKAQTLLGSYTIELIAGIFILKPLDNFNDIDERLSNGIFFLPSKLLPKSTQLNSFKKLAEKSKKRSLIISVDKIFTYIKEIHPKIPISVCIYALFIVEQIIGTILKTAMTYEENSGISKTIKFSTIETLLNIYKEKVVQRLKKANTTEINLKVQGFDYEKSISQMQIFLVNMIDQMDLILRLLKCPIKFLINEVDPTSGESDENFLSSVFSSNQDLNSTLDRSHKIVVTYSLLNELYQSLKQNLTCFDEQKGSNVKSPLEKIGLNLLELAESNVLHLFSCYSATLLQRPSGIKSFKDEALNKSCTDILEVETLNEMSFDCTIYLSFFSRYVLSTLSNPATTNASDSWPCYQTHSFTCPDCTLWDSYVQDGENTRIKEKFLVSVVKELRNRLATQSQATIINLFNSTNCNFLINTFKYLLPRLLLLPIFHFFCLYEMIENLQKITTINEEKMCLKEVISILRRTKREVKTDLTQNNWVGIYLSRLVVTGYLNCSTEPISVPSSSGSLKRFHGSNTEQNKASLTDNLEILMGVKDSLTENVIPAPLFLAAAREIGMICPEATRFYHSVCNVTPNAPAFILGFTGPTSAMLNMITTNGGLPASSTSTGTSSNASCTSTSIQGSNPGYFVNPQPFVAGMATNAQSSASLILGASNHQPGSGINITDAKPQIPLIMQPIISGNNNEPTSSSSQSNVTSNYMAKACPLSAFLHRVEEIDRILIGKERLNGPGTNNNIGDSSITPGICDDCSAKNSTSQSYQYYNRFPNLGNFILEGKLFTRDSNKRRWSDRFVILFSQCLLICKWQPNRRSPLVGQQGLKIKQRYSLRNGFHLIDVPSKADWLRFSNSLNLSTMPVNASTSVNPAPVQHPSVAMNTGGPGVSNYFPGQTSTLSSSSIGTSTADSQELQGNFSSSSVPLMDDETLCQKHAVLESLTNDTPTNFVFRLEICEPTTCPDQYPIQITSQSPNNSQTGIHFSFNEFDQRHFQPLTLYFAAENLETKADWMSSILALQTNEFLNQYIKVLPKLSTPNLLPNQEQYDFSSQDTNDTIIYENERVHPRENSSLKTSLHHAHIKSFDNSPMDILHHPYNQRKHKSNPSIMPAELLNRLDENAANTIIQNDSNMPRNHGSGPQIHFVNKMSKISFATIPKIIEKITHPSYCDLTLINIFLLTYRRFITSEYLLEILLKRFDVPKYETLIQEDPEKDSKDIDQESLRVYNKNFRDSIQFKVIFVLYKWACNPRYFKNDFANHQILRQRLINFLNNKILKPSENIDKFYYLFNREYKAFITVSRHIYNYVDIQSHESKRETKAYAKDTIGPNESITNVTNEKGTLRRVRHEFQLCQKSRSYENINRGLTDDQAEIINNDKISSTKNDEEKRVKELSNKTAQKRREFSTPKHKTMAKQNETLAKKAITTRDSDDEVEIKLSNIHPLDLAQQITLHEWNIYRSIEFWEIDGRDKGKSDDFTDQTTLNLRRSIDFSNALRNWLVLSIIRERNHEDRVVMLQRVIDLMIIMNKLNNEQGSQETKSVLISASVFRLKKVFQAVRRQKHYREIVERIRSNDDSSSPFHVQNISQMSSSASSPNSALLTGNFWKPRTSFSTNSSSISNNTFAGHLNMENFESNTSSNASNSSLNLIRHKAPSTSFEKFIKLIDSSQWNASNHGNAKASPNKGSSIFNISSSAFGQVNLPCVPFLAKGLKTRLIHQELRHTDAKINSKGEKIINVSKLRSIYALVENFLRYQNIPYDFRPIPKVQKFLENLNPFHMLKCTDQESFESQLYVLSEMYEPRDAPSGINPSAISASTMNNSCNLTSSTSSSSTIPQTLSVLNNNNNTSAMPSDNNSYISSQTLPTEERSMSREEILAANLLSQSTLNEKMSSGSLSNFYATLNIQPMSQYSQPATGQTSSLNTSGHTCQIPVTCSICNQVKVNSRKIQCDCSPLQGEQGSVHTSDCDKSTPPSLNSASGSGSASCAEVQLSSGVSGGGSSLSPLISVESPSCGNFFGRKSPSSSLDSTCENSSSSDALRVHGLWHYRLQQHRQAQAQLQFVYENHDNNCGTQTNPVISHVPSTASLSTFPPISSSSSSTANIVSPPRVNSPSGLLLSSSSGETFGSPGIGNIPATSLQQQQQGNSHQCSACQATISSIMVNSTSSVNDNNIIDTNRHLNSYLSKHRFSDVSIRQAPIGQREFSPPPPLPPRNLTSTGGHGSPDPVNCSTGYSLKNPGNNNSKRISNKTLNNSKSAVTSCVSNESEPIDTNIGRATKHLPPRLPPRMQ